jgi:anaerobic magnesium-protoporphyrin IX monomethyl ester cyclase
MNMYDLVIVHPGAAHGIYGSELAQSLIAVEPPLWARLIAGYVHDTGYTVTIIDAEADGLSPDDVRERVAELNPMLTCIAVYGHQPSASTQQMDAAIKIVDLLVADKRTTIMVGGHVAALTEGTMHECSTTYACRGEGPQTVRCLLEYMQGKRPIELVPDLARRDGRMILINAPPAALTPMDVLDGFAWNVLPMHKYRAHNWQCFGDMSKRQPYASIHTSLGCPYRCSFCCINAPFGGNIYRMRRPANVVADIRYLWQVHSVKTLKIVDEMFVLNERHYTAICKLLIEDKRRGVLPNDLNIWAYARVDTIKRDTLKMLRDAGFQWLAIGIESASEHVRDGAQKRLRTNDIIGIVRNVQSAGINVIANYMFGLPDDTAETMQQTLDMACTLNTEFANFYSAMAYPGSELYWEALDGNVLPDSWRGYSQHNSDCKPLPTATLSAAQVLAFRDFAFMHYFTRPEYISMIESKFGQEAAEHVRRMTTISLPRKLLGAAGNPEMDHVNA